MTETVAPVNLTHEQKFEMCVSLSRLLVGLCGLVLYPYQRKLVNNIIDAVLRGKSAEILILQARQSGKTEGITFAIITLSIFYISILKRPFKAGVFTPAQSQSIIVTRKRLRMRMAQIQDHLSARGVVSDLGSGITTSMYLIKDINSGKEAVIRSLSGDKTAHIKGEDLNLIILEQVEDMNEEKMKNDIFPMGSAVGGVRVLSGTPTTEIVNEYYYDRLTTSLSDEAIIIDALEAGKYNQTYKESVDMDRELLGEDSLEFRAQYLLEWGTSTIHFVENREKFLRLTRDVSDIKGIKKTAGWDPARMSDYSVLTIMEASYEEEVSKSYLTRWWHTQDTNLEEQVETVVQILIDEKVEMLVVDAIGIGIGVCDMLEKRLPRNIQLVRLIMNAQQQDEMFKLFDREIKTGRFHYTSETSRSRNLFIQQMIRAIKRFSGKYLLVEAPAGKNHYDDFCDSAALALWGLKEEEKFDTGVGSVQW